MKKYLLFIIIAVSTITSAQSILSWTERNSTLGLGYPVPIPVDTPEPFDGFRAYAGLFAKHQSIAMNNLNVTGHIVGQTRNNRDIWAYVLSDENDLTKYGVKEGAMLINGGIHAREWQSPEVLTGIMELLNNNSNDHSLHQFLLENTAIVAIPVNNVDGFLQTQRYPRTNWYSDQIGPRDGRMRRKNMLNVDEELNTINDFLLGIDLNRNNNPYWATSPRSSFNSTSIVYHGLSAHSEPETLARLNAAELVNSDQLRVYTDVHSFTLVHFSVRTNISQRNSLQSSLLSDFSRFHQAFPAGKNYINRPSGPGGGIGATDEYFALTYEIPSWTLEIEPDGNGGINYGGFGNNGHDGFILPESQIKRVREELAQTFMITWYGQAGPPSITKFKIIEKDTGILIYDVDWNINGNVGRDFNENIIENFDVNKEYSMIITFDKPMRTRNESGEIVSLQGQLNNFLNPLVTASMNSVTINVNFTNPRWLNEKNQSIQAYHHYKDDTYMVDFTLPNNLAQNSMLKWKINTIDMVSQKLDANPATVITWLNGQWQNYENNNGINSIIGGDDSSYSSPVNQIPIHEFAPLVQPTGLYFDPARDGEGFSYEILQGSNKVWIQWFTYDELGNQKWYFGLGEYQQNIIIVNELKESTGGIFGDEFNAGNIANKIFGSLEIVFGGGDASTNPVGFHDVTRTATVLFTDNNGKKLRTNLHQLTFVKGALNFPINTFAPIIEPLGLITGSWYDPSRSGEGYIIEILEDDRAILIWYTYDTNGDLMWLLDSSGIVVQNGNEITLDFENVTVTSGAKFGNQFNPDDVNRNHWGSIHFQLNCEGTGQVNYASVIDGFSSGQHDIVKLTQPFILPYTCE